MKKFRKHEKCNTAETDSKNQHSQPGTKREDDRGHKESREGLHFLLVDETARDLEILNAAIEKEQLEGNFYPYCPHRLHLSTRFGLLFYNDKIVIPENMRTTITAMLHQGHTSAAKMDQLAEAFWWPAIHREIQEKAETFPSCRAAGKNITTHIPSTEKKTENFNRTEPRNSIGLCRSNQIKTNARRCINFSNY